MACNLPYNWNKSAVKAWPPVSTHTNTQGDSLSYKYVLVNIFNVHLCIHTYAACYLETQWAGTVLTVTLSPLMFTMHMPTCQVDIRMFFSKIGRAFGRQHQSVETNRTLWPPSVDLINHTLEFHLTLKSKFGLLCFIVSHQGWQIS